MRCVKCDNEMVKTTLSNPPCYYGEWIKRSMGYADIKKPYSPYIAYVCEECGYMEFYYKDIEE